MSKRQLEKIALQIKKCKKCSLWKTRKNAVPGEGPYNAKIMLIGQAPGREEDKQGRPFVGKAGKLLDELLLRKNKIERKKCFITSVLKCFPPKNRKPKDDEIRACKHYLLKQIEIIKPKVIILLGEIATQTIFGKAKLNKIRGKPFLINKTIYLATYHPAAARFPKIKKAMQKDFAKLKQIIKFPKLK